MNLTKIARELGVTAPTIRSRLNKLKIPLETPNLKDICAKNLQDYPIQERKVVSESKYYSVYNDIVKKGYIKSNELRNIFNLPADSILVNFERLGLLVYEDTENVDRGKNMSYVVKPFNPLKEEWKNEWKQNNIYTESIQDGNFGRTN